MKKILLAFDGEHFSHSIFDFVKHMNTQQPVLAVGCFLPSVDYTELLYSFGGVPSGPFYMAEAVKGNPEIVARNVDYFRNLCAQNDIACSIHQSDAKRIVTAIKLETRYADLLLIEGKTFYENLGKDTQQDYVTNVLHEAECPVIIVPENFHAPESLIFAYDGSEQSVFAIKQFHYLFPFYTDLHALLVYFASKEKQLPERQNIHELLDCYYKNTVITKMNIRNREEIAGWLQANRNIMFVCGSYGRNVLRELFHHSFASAITTQSQQLLFIAHK